MEITTKSGFRCSIDPEEVADDYELFEAVADLESGNKLALWRVGAYLLRGDKNRLIEHCRRPSGRPSAKAFETDVAEILNAVKEHRAAKNS